MIRIAIAFFIIVTSSVASFAQENGFKLHFLTESEGHEINQLLDSSVVAALASANAKITMAITDFSEDRVEAIKKLSQAKIPVSAWLLMPKEEGYRTKLSNVADVKKRYQIFAEWSARQGLPWESVVLEVVPEKGDTGLFLGNKWDLVKNLTQRLFNAHQSLGGARMEYVELADMMKVDGFEVEIFISPMQADEKAVNASSYQELAQVYTLPVDMAYTKIHSRLIGNYPNSLAYMQEYAKISQGVVIGSTRKSRQLVYRTNDAIIGWEELSRILTFGKQKNIPLIINNLEGCVEQGFIPLILKFKYDKEISQFTLISEELKQKQNRSQWLLRILDYPILLAIFGAITMILFLVVLFKFFRWIF